MDRHRREELLHRPVVGHRLEEREVAVVGVAELPLEALELVRDVGQVAHDLEDLLAARPEQLLDAGAGLEVQHAEVEGRDRLLLDLEGVVVGLLEVLARDAGVGLAQLADHRVLVRRGRLRALAGQDLVRREHVVDEHRVVRDERAAGLGDEIGVRHAARVAGLGHLADDVGRVLLERVVHRGVEVRLAAVVVDAEPAAAVQVAHRRAEAVQLDEDPARLAQRVLDGADVRDLGADVEVEQLQAVQHPDRAQLLDGGDDLGRGQAELGAVARRLHPLAGALRGEARAHADHRPQVQLGGGRQDRVQLARRGPS